MHRITITGGKGGTGKSFLAVNLAVLLSTRYRLVLTDLDLEAPNDYILLGLDEPGEAEPIKLFLPFINTSKCTRCGICSKICDTGAILAPPNSYPVVFPRLCSGCKACYYGCPYNAINEGYHVLGYIYRREVEINGSKFLLITGALREGEEHTPPGVYRVKEEAVKHDPEILLIDTGAGTGNQVSIALKDSDLVIVVTEPTPLGLHDMIGVLKITSEMKLRTWVVVNRAGFGDDNPHYSIGYEYGVENIYRIPYHRDVVESYVNRKPIVVSNPDSIVSKIINELVNDLYKVIEGNRNE